VGNLVFSQNQKIMRAKINHCIVHMKSVVALTTERNVVLISLFWKWKGSCTS